jgi:hypothetical protein
MFRDPTFDDVVTSGISSGDSLWLVVARTLKPASDAAISEGLEMSLGAALPRNPTAVLQLLRDPAAHFDLAWVCGGEVLLDDVDTLRADTVNRAHRKAARAALRAVDVPELKAARDSCLARLGPPD